MNPTHIDDPTHRAGPAASRAPTADLPVDARQKTTDHARVQRDPLATTDTLDVACRPHDVPSHAGRCRIEAEIGRGGMGLVLRAVDPVFGRQLAVKVLLARADEQPDKVRRFLDEARLTGRLQHPGVPPVHEQGTLEDGRPYFTMKLIQGRTLGALLQDRSTSLDDLPRFVTIFGQVCQTVAYAHSQGVIHRDLKPDNIMVGAFGEVQVMDWGLAKQMKGEARSAEEASPDPGDATATSHDTLAGQALGTPAYMAPEQARGDLEELDERTDVFGLGAILCTVLTGKPPHQGATLLEVLTRAQQGDLTNAWKRLDECGADGELIALARACLSPEAARRPPDAGEVALATARYQEGVQQRLQQAERERSAAQVKAFEERKRRRVWLALAGVILAALAVGGSVWLWLGQQRVMARAQLNFMLEDSQRSLAEGKTAEATAAAQHAKGLLLAVGNDAELQRQVDERLREIQFVDLLEKIRTPENTAQERISSRARADGRYAQAFRDLGIDMDALDTAAAAHRIEERPALKPYLVAAMDDWVGPRRQASPTDASAVQRLLDVARRVDPDPWRDRLRESAGRDDVAALVDLAAGADVRTQTISALLALAEQLMDRGRRKAAVDLLRKAQWEHPDDFWLPFYQGLWQGNDSDPAALEEGTRCYAVAVALRPHNVEAWAGYSLMLEKQGRIDEALTASRRAVALEPNSCSAQMALEGALTCKGDSDGARQARRRAVELLREQVRQDPGDDEAWVCLGVNLERLGERTEALDANREAFRLAPHNAWATHNVGALLRKSGKPAEALPWLEQAVRLSPDSAYMLSTLGLARADTGAGPAAEEAFRKAIELQPYYLPAYGSLAEVLRVRGDPTGSQAALRDGLRECREVLEKVPNSFRAEFLMGYFLWKSGDLAGSVEHSRKAIQLGLTDADAYANLSMALHQQGLLDQAVEASRQGARRAEPSVLVYNNLAFDLIEKGESSDEAAAAVQQALKIDPDSDLATLTRAEVLRAQGKFVESLEAYRRGHDLHRQKAVQKWPTADWVRDAERLVRLDGDLPAVTRGEHQAVGAAENLEFGRLCGYKQRYAAAARFYETAFVLDPRIADDLGAGDRTQAAKCAALAGVGCDADAPVDERERAHWRRQTLDWLRADLNLWQRAVDGGTPGRRNAARQALNRWRTHDDLIEVRDAAALAQLPEG